MKKLLLHDNVQPRLAGLFTHRFHLSKEDAELFVAVKKRMEKYIVIKTAFIP